MAGGWLRDGAVSDRIEAMVAEGLARLRARGGPSGGGERTHCAECDAPIPEARRRALPGVALCIDCQRAQDARRGGGPRRGG